MVERLVCIQEAQGSIPWSSNFLLNEINIKTSGYSSVGRAGDCSCLKLKSLGHWFDSGWPDFFYFFRIVSSITSYFIISTLHFILQGIRPQTTDAMRQSQGVRGMASYAKHQTQRVRHIASDAKYRTQRVWRNASHTTRPRQCFRLNDSDSMLQTQAVRRNASNA